MFSILNIFPRQKRKKMIENKLLPSFWVMVSEHAVYPQVFFILCRAVFFFLQTKKEKGKYWETKKVNEPRWDGVEINGTWTIFRSSAVYHELHFSNIFLLFTFINYILTSELFFDFFFAFAPSHLLSTRSLPRAHEHTFSLSLLKIN